MIRRTTLACSLLAASALTMSMLPQSGNTGGGKPGQTPPGGQTPPAGQPVAPGQVGGAAGATANAQGLSLQRSDKLIGTEIQDASGTKIGRINDLVLRGDGAIAYAVVAGSDGQSTLIPVPWRSLRFTTPPAETPGAAGSVGLSRPSVATLTSVDAARWKTAPNFDTTAWPKDNDLRVWDESDTFFAPPAAAGGGVGVREASAPRAGAFFRASKLQSQAVVDANGQPVGRLGQLVFDPAAGRLNYAAVSIDDASGANGRVVAMPWETLRASRLDEKDRFQLTAPRDRLTGAPEFAIGDEGWKQMSDPMWVGEMYNYYSVRPYWSSNNAGKAPAPANPAKPGDTGGKPQGDKPQGDKPAGGNKPGNKPGGKGGG
ncbi:MAG TPA: PRC-barrel domain-containing protein [Planctomycetota bacterium]|nr:PRC-barrel domain-containing protein [Planctomycetota bacterium]